MMRRAFKSALVVLLVLSGLGITRMLSPTLAAPDEAGAPNAPAQAAESATGSGRDEASLPTITAARLSMAPGRARLILELSATTAFAIVSLDKPDRIAVDVKASAVAFDQPSPPAGSGMVSDYKVEMAGPDRARVTLDLIETAQVQQAYVLEPLGDQPARLVVDLIPVSPKQFAMKVAADLAASRTGSAGAGDEAPPQAPPAGAAARPVAASPAPASPVPATVPPEAAAAGTGKPLIVIDPGHGGIDSGAKAGDGMLEKTVVLQFALKLQKLLAESGRFDVALTRTDDSYLTLSERVSLARANRADLFVSIHADTFADPDIRGFTVYTRNQNATGELDKILADNENRADVIAPYAAPDTPPQVVDLLLDLMERQTRRRSFVAAQDIIDAVSPSLELRKIPIRRADFFVLQAPEVPSVLVELGFLSNAHDKKELEDQAWQKRAAEALAQGIAGYFADTAVPIVTARN